MSISPNLIVIAGGFKRSAIIDNCYCVITFRRGIFSVFYCVLVTGDRIVSGFIYHFEKRKFTIFSSLIDVIHFFSRDVVHCFKD